MRSPYKFRASDLRLLFLLLKKRGKARYDYTRMQEIKREIGARRRRIKRRISSYRKLKRRIVRAFRKITRRW